MVDFPSAVAVPSTSAYGGPLLDFNWLADLPKRYYQGQQDQFQQRQNKRTEDLQQPVDATDTQSVLREVLRRGGAASAEALLPFLLQQEQLKQAQQVDPLLAGVSPGGAQPSGNPPPASMSSGQPTSMSVPVTQQGGDAGTGTITDIVTDQYGMTADAGRMIARIGMVMDVDPNAQLSPGQQKRVAGLLKRYSGNTGGPQSGVPQNGTNALGAAGETPAIRIADAFAAVQPGVKHPPGQTRTGAVTPQPPQGPAPQPPAVAAPQPPQGPQGAPQATGAPPPSPAQPGAQGGIGPQVPLPKGFTDPQQAILALRAEAAKLSANPYGRGQAQMLQDWATSIEQSTQPMEVRPGETLMDRRSGRIMFQAPAANPAGVGQLVNMENAERIARGDAPMTAQEEISFIQGIRPPRSAPAMAVEQFKQDFQKQNGRAPTAEEITAFASNYSREQSYGRAAGSQGARVENAANEVVQLIPQALEASKTVPRGRWVPFNQLVQKWDQGTSDPAYNDFMMANFSLLNAYTRAMNPQGVPRIQERLEQHAIGVLSTATDEQAYEVQVRRLWKEVQASKIATAETAKGVKPGDINAPVPGLDQGASSGAQSPDKNGWITLPSGVKIREMQAGQ